MLRHRIHQQRTAGVATALRAADGASKVPAGWFDALSDWPEEAREAAYQVNSDRMEARIKARARMRG